MTGSEWHHFCEIRGTLHIEVLLQFAEADYADRLRAGAAPLPKWTFTREPRAAVTFDVSVVTRHQLVYVYEGLLTTAGVWLDGEQIARGDD